MACGSCIKKLALKLIENHRKELDLIRAFELAEKAIERVESRQKLERKKHFFKVRIQSRLFKWTFLINFRATIFHSFLNRRLIWVGRGFNPAYSLACTGTNGTTHCEDDACIDPPHNRCARSCTGGTCTCPAPTDPHSHQTTSTCGQVYGGACGCRLSGGIYSCYSVGAVCICGGTCGYECDPGYTWNGALCVLSGYILRRLLVGEGL